MAGAQRCNPATWGAADLAGRLSTHVTSAQHSAQDRARLARALAGQPDVRRHLCRLSGALGYDPEHCRPSGRRL